jgi:hypothetical protein
LFALLGIPIALGLVEPNNYYGVRTATTLANEASWYRANGAAGWAAVVSGLIGQFINYRIGRSAMTPAAKTNAYLGVMLTVAAIMVTAGLTAS